MLEGSAELQVESATSVEEGAVDISYLLGPLFDSSTAEVLQVTLVSEHCELTSPDLTVIGDQSSSLVIPRVDLPELNLNTDLLVGGKVDETLLNEGTLSPNSETSEESDSSRTSGGIWSLSNSPSVVSEIAFDPIRFESLPDTAGVGITSIAYLASSRALLDTENKVSETP